jgi:hypothetical protein
MLLETVSEPIIKPTPGWPDRYRPETLDAMALDPDTRERFKRYLAGDELPRSLVLHGPPGFGKTTVARIISRALYSGKRMSRAWWVKAPENGDVEMMRTKVIDFMRSLSLVGGGGKLLVFEEAEGFSTAAMQALRDPLEKYYKVCRVIFITNDLSKLDAPLKSRCDVIRFERPPLDECARMLGEVLKAEGKEVAPADVHAFTRGHFAADGTDLRSLLASAQEYMESPEGRLPAPPIPAQAERAERLDELWRAGGPKTDASEGAQILDDLATEFSKYLALPRGGVEALSLWTVFTWAHEAFGVSPILTLVSPTMRAGKSTVFEMLEQLLIPETYHPSSITSAVVFRLKGIAEANQGTPPTEAALPKLCLLIDEADWLKVRGDLQQVLNSGHNRRTAFVFRMKGAGVGKFSSWYPKALALIDRPSSPLPSTVRDRSILIPMERAKPGESRPKFPRHQTVPELAALQERILLWLKANYDELRALAGSPVLLSAEDLNSRARDNWHPLMCIARLAGGDWETHARQASLILAGTTRETERLVELLCDIRDVLETADADTLRSVELVGKLVFREASTWKDQRLTPTKLADMLRPLGIGPRQTWTQTLGQKANKNCYHRADFNDAFERYLR